MDRYSTAGAQRLLARYDISTPCLAYHQHNKLAQLDETGLDDLFILFDDMRGDVPGLRKASLVDLGLLTAAHRGGDGEVGLPGHAVQLERVGGQHHGGQRRRRTPAQARSPLGLCVVVQRRAPAVAPAALGVVEFAPAALGRPSLFDGQGRLRRQPPPLGGLFAGILTRYLAQAALTIPELDPDRHETADFEAL